MKQPTPVTLCGKHVRLEPLLPAHAAGLLAIGRDESIWTWLTRGPLVDFADAQGWVADALAAAQAGTQLPFGIIATADDALAGTTRYLNISVADEGLEIGWTWLASVRQRTAVNTECKLLLLAHAFDELEARRVQLKTDARNDRSRRAIERIGARFEGILRKYQRTRDGRIRDTAMYSILDEEWPATRARLTALLATS